MALDDVKDQAPEQENSNVGKTNVKVDRSVLSDLKQEVNVSSNAEVAHLVESAIAEYLGDSERAEEYENQFAEQFEE